MTERIRPDIGIYNDKIAHMYDMATHQDGWERINDFVARVLRGHVTNVQSALDLGAGTGQTLGVVHSFAQPQRIIAVDASAEMLSLLRQKYPSPTIQPVQATIEDYVAATTDTFDVITAIGSLEFVPNLPAVIHAASRLLNPGGTLAATFIPQADGDEPSRTFEVERLDAAFTEYRWDPDYIMSQLSDGGLAASLEIKPAYNRGDEVVNYGFIAASRPLIKTS